jgi:arylsulfatase A-like enzyme
MTDRPNILIIHSDQHRADCLGAYGNQDVRTPNIDRLAQSGILYEQAYCPLPVCTPSRYSFLTGLYVHQHGGWTNHCTLPAGYDTFPDLLRRSGYRTCAIGKMHFTPTYLDVGFEHMLLAEQHGPGRYDDDYHRYLQQHGVVDVIDTLDQVDEYRSQAPARYRDAMGALESDLPEEHHSTSWIGRHALLELEQWGSQPSLLMVGFIKPHHPHDPPAPWSTLYRSEDLNLLDGWQLSCPEIDLRKHRGFFNHDSYTEQTMRSTLSLYYASISQIDEWVGRMTSLLERKGLLANTIVVYTSDHGDYMGYHHMVGKNGHMYDPIVRVPLIIKPVEGAPTPQKRRGLISTVDFAPTLLEAVGVSRGRGMDGLNILRDNAQREVVFAENHRGSDYMVRTDEYKLLMTKDSDSSLLFDLRRDPMETVNRYHDIAYAEVRQSLTSRLLRWILFEASGVEPVHEIGTSPVPNEAADAQFRGRHEMRDYIGSMMKHWLNS